MSEPEPPKPSARTGWARSRLPFDAVPSKQVKAIASRTVVLFYAVLAVALASLAVYMSVIAQMPLMSAYVIAPAIGAAWFALRVFMLVAPKG